MTAPIVSVLMTSYNRELHIGQAIDSVLASTMQDFELIVVDDRSKDRTVEIVRQYAEKDSRVKVYVNEQNLGDYPNRNKAASYATGKYLKYVDADDYIYPWGLQLLVQMMEQYPEAGWGLCSLIQIKDKPYPILLSSKEIYEYNYFKSMIFHKAPLSSIIKKEVFEKEGGFAPLRMVGDNEFWQRLALKYPVLLMPDGMVWYREHENQEVKFYRQYILQYEELKLKYLKDPSCPLSGSQVASIKSMMKNAAFKRMLQGMLRLNLSTVSDQFKIWWFYMNKA